MAHHAYLYIGNQEEGIEEARAFLAKERGLAGPAHPDISLFVYDGTFPVDDARRVISFSHQAPVAGAEKAIVIAAERIFHQTQNALLKTFEEPPQGTTIILIVPALGVLLPTLRSRLVELPRNRELIPEEASTFLSASATERAKIVTKLLTRAKDGKDEEKQSARMEAARLARGLMLALKEQPSGEEGRRALADLTRFMPILHTSSAPLKLIFEHLLLVLPANRVK